MEVEFIQASEEHLQALTDLRVEFVAELSGQPGQDAEMKLRQELKKYFEQAIPTGEYVMWLAKVGNEYVSSGGMVVCRRPGNFKVPAGLCGYIMSMYTKPPFRKNGFAGEILQRLLQTGKEVGVEFFELHATKDGEPLYIKNDFKMHSEPTYRKFVAK